MTAPSRPRFLLCAPTHYAVEYVINPWMDGNVGRVQRDQALRQWERLHEEISRRAEVLLAEPRAGLPDMAFAANAGLVADGVFVPARFAHPQRHAETAQFSAVAERLGLHVSPLRTQAAFEGEGDALFQPGQGLLWAAYGVRTHLEAHRDLAELFGVEVLSLRIVDARFYHLDTCFAPLPDGAVLWYPPAFDRASQDLVRSRVPAQRRHEVEAEDALGFACNAVVAGDAVLMSRAGDGLRHWLQARGLEPVVVPMSEFILAGGAAKCLSLRLDNTASRPAGAAAPACAVRDRVVELTGHLLDSGVMNRALDAVEEHGGSFGVEAFEAGLRRDQASLARLRVLAPDQARLDDITAHLIRLGARVVDGDRDAVLETVMRDGVAPDDFYSTTIYPTEVRVDGAWLRVSGQRMDVVVRVPAGGDPDTPAPAECALIRDLRRGDRVVTGVEGIRIHVPPARRAGEEFSFMSAGVSSERRVELAVDEVAWEMRRVRERGGRIVVVAGPVVIHTGGGAHLARLIRGGYVQALLGGNAIAVHDIEQNLFGTSLGVDLARGVGVHGGHRHHLKAINLVRRHGGIPQAVAGGAITGGVLFECVKAGIPFALAGSIRDDGPLPETMMDLLEAQREYARLIAGADIILMLSSMLHAIGTGNMTPGGVRLICVDISPAVVTKLADRGSLESVGIVTDVGLFLNLLDRRLLD
jgi:lysine-ketoglutarate reductase/saccharopine dehydrogenase-like protein (TIGR00300 family)